MIDIVAIHIEKTGGTSFYEILKSVYGAEKIIRFRRIEVKKILDSNLKIEEKLPEKATIIQGHIWYPEVKEIVEKYNSKIIVWFRDPVERVISNYTFWEYQTRVNPEHPEKHRIGEPLELYITRPETQNKMYRSLEGMNLSDAFFIGFLENFDEDLRRLGEKLNWPEIPYFHEKNSKTYDKPKPVVSEALKKEIMRLNSKDVKLYRQAIKLYKRRKFAFADIFSGIIKPFS
jgi:hypothetical protein